MAYNANKDLKLYYSISEVATMFNVPETLLRYWEKMFPENTIFNSSGSVYCVLAFLYSKYSSYNWFQ